MQVTYHQTHSFTDCQGVSHSLATQFYQIGIYGILDNNSSMQMNLTPKELVKIEKKLVKNEKEGKISNLSFGSAITVSDKSGLWEIVSREYATVPDDMPPFKIFIQKNKTYASRSRINGVFYYMTVVKIIKDKTDLKYSLVEFSVSPICTELSKFAIGENLYRAEIPIFQQTINKNPITNPSTN